MSKLLVLLLFLTVVVIILRFQGNRYSEFMAASAKTTALIINKEEVPRRADQPNRKERVVIYSYNIAGVDYIGRDTVEYSDLWEDFKENQNIEIYYLRENPKQSYPVILLDRRVKSRFF